MSYDHITLGFLDSKECAYHPNRGFILPKLAQEILGTRNIPPFELYAFLQEHEGFPYVALFDSLGKGSEIFPAEKTPHIIQPKAEKRIVLPKDFEKALRLDDRVRVTGEGEFIAVWNPADEKITDHIQRQKLAEIFE